MKIGVKWVKITRMCYLHLEVSYRRVILKNFAKLARVSVMASYFSRMSSQVLIDLRFFSEQLFYEMPTGDWKHFWRARGLQLY